LGVIIKFPYFDSVKYGSVVGMSWNPPVELSGTGWLIIFLCLSATVILILGLITVLISYRRNQAKRYYEYVK